MGRRDTLRPKSREETPKEGMAQETNLTAPLPII